MKRFFLFFLLNIIAIYFLNAQNNVEYPYQDISLSTDQRVNDLIGRMTLQEKANQLFNQAPAISRLGIPAYNWWNESLHGVARAGKATVFPQAIGLASSFDEALLLRLATAISDEARAKHNYFLKNNVRSIYTGLTFWSPNINIFRDPRWGRGQETYGEDPYLTGRMAVNFIKGLQGEDSKYFKTIATAKHYAVHSGPEFTRHIDNTFINDRDLYETYLPAFKAAVKEANVQSVMCAYNRLRDQPCCGSNLLLSTILRKDFGFQGYVVSDCGAITDFYKKENHHVVQTPAQAWGWSLSAGTDLNCEESRAFVEDHLDSAVQYGILNEKDINTALTRLFKARFQLGMFDPPDQVKYSSIPMEVVGSQKHLQLALEAAEKSLVLLKNDGVLPLKKNIKNVALIGPNADNFSVLVGNYNGEPIHPITPLTALRERLGNSHVYYSPGGPIVPGVYTNFELVAPENLFHLENGKLAGGLEASYYTNKDIAAKPAIVRVDKSINFNWERSPINQTIEEEFTVKWSGILMPKASGIYQFKAAVTGGEMEIKIDGRMVAGSEVTLEKGKRYKIEVSLVIASFWWGNTVESSAKLLWVKTLRDYKREALDVAQKSDIIIFCGGISPNLEGEEMKLETDGFAHGDRTHINMPPIQEDLLKALHATGKPIVYVNFSGSAIAMNWEKENLPAIVQAFYPGEATGAALTRMLFGEYNPSGRLPITFYKTINDLPDFSNYNMQGRTYRYFKGEPLFEFGFGLSYTTFQYKKLKVSSSAISAGEKLTVSVDVTNTGSMDGEEVVQIYLTHLNSSVPTPVRTLIGFKRVRLKRGESSTVDFTLGVEQLAILNKNYVRVVEPGDVLLSVGGKQPDNKGSTSGAGAQVQVKIGGNPIVIKD